MKTKGTKGPQTGPVRKPLKTKRRTGNPTKGGKIFGNWQDRRTQRTKG